MNEIDALREDFRRAYYNTSFTPDVRADTCVRDFSAELEGDLLELGDRAGDYAQKYVGHLKVWAARKSRCLSAMIIGPAKFPTERNRKAMNSEENAWQEFRAWRERYIKAVFRERTKTPEEEIDDALLKLEKERNAHTLMIEVNKIMRKKATDYEKRKMMVDELEVTPAFAEKVLTSTHFCGERGFMPFELSNSNARIKSIEEKVLTMRARIARRDAFEPIAFPGGTITIENDRVIIKHDEKPPREVIEALKGHGFHWSSKYVSWCRKHTANAIRDAKAICRVTA